MADNVNAIRAFGTDGGKCYVAPMGSTLPTGLDPFGTEWWDLGAIDPTGFNEAYEEERNEKRPLGYKSPVRTDIISVTKTITTPLWETNPYTQALYDGVDLSDMVELPGGILTYPVHRPTGQRRYMLAVDTFDGTNHERTVAAIAEVTSRGERPKNAENVTATSLTWTIYEASDGLMFNRYFLSDGMWLPVESMEIGGTATVAVAATTQLTATATYYNATSDDVSADADWDTSAPTIATVDSDGTVTGVTAGTATISAMYRGVTDTLSVTVTA
ncbi:Ig-like domain-containing protein [Nocardiopsis changdeensis]|uniref:Ig-like domain-containing protein n=1 Tax=Nocardiopsis changdeensis TaxID=2831969 RepID=A0ABX8BE42_9ACTN|nr:MULTISPECIES: Ig-like domain-containing protein [Nocardiopsis]QUX20307.1 Ig-like domain-containing protein [Nocardiopsis changdeensis]QYX36237.1 Ig-like domain-containing protein [Nocardiopsis sp. MT53]